MRKKIPIFMIVLIMMAMLFAGCFMRIKDGNGDDQSISGNLALNKQYFASSEYGKSYTASFAFDGVVGKNNRWSAAKGEAIDQFIGVDFGRKYKYNLVEIDQSSYPRVSKYVLQYSNDGVNYTDIPGTGVETIPAETTISLSFETIESQYLRLFIYESRSEKNPDEFNEPTIDEIEVYLVKVEEEEQE